MNDQLSDQGTFAPIVFNESNQAKQIAHFQMWVKRVSEERVEYYYELLCRGFTKFIELDLLRYGRKPGSFTGKRGFGFVRQSSAARSFVESEIMPTDVDAAALLTLVADGRLLMGTGYTDGEPTFFFCEG